MTYRLQSNHLIYYLVTSYEIIVYTGDKTRAGTNSQVYITLFGKDGKRTEKIHLKNSNNKDPFERNQTDKFSVKSDYIGELIKLRIEHDNSGLSPGWFLDRIVVTDLHDPKTKYVATCNQWLAKDEGDKQISRELMLNKQISGTKQNNQYKITVYTGNKSGAGTDADVFITLYGNLRETGGIRLENNKNMFEAGQKDEFTVECPTVGVLNKILIAHNNKGSAPGWFLDRILIEDVNAHHLYEFPCNRWLAKNEDDKQISRLLFPKTSNDYGKQLVRKNQYKITVYTGNKSGAGTDADVFITLYGNLAETDAIQLDNKSNNFEAGKKDEFTIECPAVGVLNKILIAHNDKGLAPGWFLDRILIEDVNAHHIYEFPCNRWLANDEDDKQIARFLFPKTSADYEKPPVRKNQYKITVYTGNKSGAGTDADVFITLYGNLAETGAVQLDNKNNNFEAGKKDEFIIECPTVGILNKILIAHNNKGLAPGWFLDRILIEDVNAHHIYEFPCNRWLAKNEDDKQIARFLFPKTSADYEKPSVRKNQYKITVYTGNKSGAGTDADVFITLYGNLAETDPIQLDNKSNNFEAGKKDEFTIECPTVGLLNKILIAHNNKGLAPGWFLDRILIEDVNAHHIYEFPCNRWLAKDEDDKQIARFLFPKTSTDYENQPTAGILYYITVYTGDKINAGTDSRVYIVMHGKNVSSGQIFLSDGKFEKKSVDKFTVNAPPNLSPLTALDIGHDNSGFGPGWYLDKVVVDCPSTSIKQTFPCYNWLADDEGDRRIERRLKEDLSLRKTRRPTVPWYIWVYTSDRKGAATHTQVIAVLYGYDGKSTNIKLEKNSNTLQQGHCDQYKADINDVGIPFKLRVYLNDNYLSDSWHLDRIEMENLKTNQQYFFYCGRWLSKTLDDKQIIRELPATGSLISRPLPLLKYIVDVYTGNKPNAGTDANVFINIYGQCGDTGVRPLEYSLQNKNKFQRNQIDTFIIEAVLLKKIRKIRIGHDDTGVASGWFLNKVEIRLEDQSFQPVTFISDRWLAIDQDDGRISCELFPYEDKGDSKIQRIFYDTNSQSVINSTESLTRPTEEYIRYIIKIKTGELSHSATSANVSIRLIGSTGRQTRFIQLDPIQRRYFQPGTIETFPLEEADVGDIDMVEIEHNDYTSDDSWFLETLTVDIPTKGRTFYFVCNQWLSRYKADGITKRIFKRQDLNKPSFHQLIPYVGRIYTGHMEQAGSDCDVCLKLFGTIGSSSEHIIRKNQGNFERSAIDAFQCQLEDVGQPVKLRVTILPKSTYGRNQWFLEKIQLIKLTKEYIEEETFLCELNDWITHKSDYYFDIPIRKDNKLYRNQYASLTSTGLVLYQINVTTSDIQYAGTTQHGWIIIQGNKTRSEKLFMKNTQNNQILRRGQMDTFTFECQPLGELRRIILGHEGQHEYPLKTYEGDEAMWHVSHITITDLSTGIKYEFPVRQWIALNNDGDVFDCVNKKEYSTVEEYYRRTINYKIIVHTGYVSGANTDANVSIILYGTRGNTSNILLKQKGHNLFEHGAVEELIIECLELGKLTKLHIEYHNSMFLSDWFLDKVEIINMDTHEKVIFPCNQSFTGKHGNHETQRDLLPIYTS
ncbi:unnamed protein product [Rotaria sordida]|uniref:PLAT domain-containing protein n=1 Tax=Rotaria sordida TaxID=392033 RepID=A0A819G4X2_9BILA|nr:unnamed protein product [Rotaria sordida]CAF3876301.1 unnamed protein product [Rotaria sordida]